MSHGNVMIPSHVNTTSRVNTTCGNATSRLMKIQNTTGNFSIQHMKYCMATCMETRVKMKL